MIADYNWITWRPLDIHPTQLDIICSYVCHMSRYIRSSIDKDESILWLQNSTTFTYMEIQWSLTAVEGLLRPGKRNVNRNFIFKLFRPRQHNFFQVKVNIWNFIKYNSKVEQKTTTDA